MAESPCGGPEARPPRGATVTCTSSKDPRDIMRQVVNALGARRVSYKQNGQWAVKCQRQTMKFEINVSQLEESDLYVLSFKRVSGDLGQYKILCSNLLAEMQL